MKSFGKLHTLFRDHAKLERDLILTTKMQTIFFFLLNFSFFPDSFEVWTENVVYVDIMLYKISYGDILLLAGAT